MMLQRLLAIGILPDDGASLVAQKRLLMSWALMIIVAGLLWAGLYLALGFPFAALLPVGYAVASAVSVLLYSRGLRYGHFRTFQLLLILIVPALLQISVGGFIDGGAVVLWSMLCVTGAALFADRRQLIRWFVAFLVVLALVGGWEAAYAEAPQLSRTLCLLSFLANVSGVSAVIMGSQAFHAQLATELQEQLRGEREVAEAARKEAEQSSAAKSVFLATMSHEIRTPLNGVVGLAHLLGDTELDRGQAEYLKQLQIAAGSLRQLIDDLLDFSKIEAGQLELASAPFTVDALLDPLRVVMGPVVAERDLEFVLDARGVPPVLVGDQQRLGQVLLNLVSNAARFTQEGEVVVTLRGERRPTGGHALSVRVRDSGIGIRPENQARLFQPFVQADGSISRRYGGTGLGLSICRRLVALMGGEIGVESELGVGSTFHFWVPLEEAPPSERSAPPRLPGRVLIVDDHAVAGAVMKQTLTDEGIEAEVVMDAEGGLARLRDPALPPPDVVFLDCELGEHRGVGLVRPYVEAARKAGSRLVVIKPHASKQAQVSPASLDLAGVLSKPVTRAPLLQFLDELLVEDGGGATAPPQAPVAADLTGLRILVAEDNSINQLIVRRLLAARGAVVTVANDGLEAVEAVLAACPVEPFDLVLMDAEMPNMDGLTATRVLRREHGLVDLPIIAFTAHALDEYREACAEAGMDGFCTKPLQAEVLFEAVLDAVTARKAL